LIVTCVVPRSTMGYQAAMTITATMK